MKKHLPCIFKFLNGQIVNLAKPMAKAFVDAPELELPEMEKEPSEAYERIREYMRRMRFYQKNGFEYEVEDVDNEKKADEKETDEKKTDV